MNKNGDSASTDNEEVEVLNKIFPSVFTGHFFPDIS